MNEFRTLSELELQHVEGGAVFLAAPAGAVSVGIITLGAVGAVAIVAVAAVAILTP